MSHKGPPNKPHDLQARVVAALMGAGVCSVTAICKLLFDNTKHRRSVAQSIEKLREHGAVRVHSYGPDGFARYELQRKPFGQPDMPPPETARPDLTSEAGRAPQRFSIGGELLSVRQVLERYGGGSESHVRRRLREGWRPKANADKGAACS